MSSIQGPLLGFTEDFSSGEGRVENMQKGRRNELLNLLLDMNKKIGQKCGWWEAGEAEKISESPIEFRRFAYLESST